MAEGPIEYSETLRSDIKDTRIDAVPKSAVKPWHQRLQHLGREVARKIGGSFSSENAQVPAAANERPFADFRIEDPPLKWEDKARANLAALLREFEEIRTDKTESPMDNADLAFLKSDAADKLTFDLSGKPLLRNSYGEYGVKGALLAILEYPGENGDEVYGIFVPSDDIKAVGAHHRPDTSQVVNIAKHDPQTGKFNPSKRGELIEGNRLTIGPATKERDFSSIATISEDGKLEITTEFVPVSVLAHAQTKVRDEDKQTTEPIPVTR